MFNRSPKTEKLLAIFRGTNDLLTYERIANEMGEPLDDLRQTIACVRLYLERDEGVVFLCERKVGYRRLTDAEKVESSATIQHKIRRTAVKGVMRINAVSDMAGLSNEQQMLAILRKTVFEAVQREAATKK